MIIHGNYMINYTIKMFHQDDIKAQVIIYLIPPPFIIADSLNVWTIEVWHTKHFVKTFYTETIRKIFHFTYNNKKNYSIVNLFHVTKIESHTQNIHIFIECISQANTATLLHIQAVKWNALERFVWQFKSPITLLWYFLIRSTLHNVV